MPDGSEAAVRCIMQMLDIYAKVPESNLEVATGTILKHVAAFDSCVTVPQSPKFHAVPLNQLDQYTVLYSVLYSSSGFKIADPTELQ